MTSRPLFGVTMRTFWIGFLTAIGGVGLGALIGLVGAQPAPQPKVDEDKDSVLVLPAGVELRRVPLADFTRPAATKYPWPTPQDYGAKGDGTTDDTKAMQRWLDAACKFDGLYGPGGTTVYLPPGVYLVTDSLHVHNVGGLVVRGERHSSRVVYDGLPDQPVFDLSQVHSCQFHDLWLGCKARGSSSAFRVRNAGPGEPAFRWTTSACQWHNVTVGTYGGRWQSCWDVDTRSGGGSDANNEFHLWQSCVAGDYVQAGWRVKGSQVHGLVFDACRAYGHGGGKYGWLCDYGCYVTVRDCWATRHTEADVGLLNFFVRATISGLNSEHSARMLVTGGPSGALFPVTVEDCRWDSQHVPEDGEIIRYLAAGPLSVTGCTFGLINGRGVIRCHTFGPPWGPRGQVRVTGNGIKLWGVDPPASFLRCVGPWDSLEAQNVTRRVS